MNTLEILIAALAFIVKRLEANAVSKDRQAAALAEKANRLLAKRMAAMETAAKAAAIAGNINKLTSV
jgi:hypothetical protein